MTKRLTIGIVIVIMFLVIAVFMLRSYTGMGALGGFSSDTEPTTIKIANTQLFIPSNMIRFRDQRESSALSKIDLFVQWPSMKGFTTENATTFQGTNKTTELIFITLEAGPPLHPAHQKLKELYRRFFTNSPWRGPAGLIGNALDSSSGYLSEDVLYAQDDDELFLTRCLQEGKDLTNNLKPTCIYEFTFEDGINAYIRFHRSLLVEWQALDERVKRLLATMRTTG